MILASSTNNHRLVVNTRCQVRRAIVEAPVTCSIPASYSATAAEKEQDPVKNPLNC
jgi:hypothetical protein